MKPYKPSYTWPNPAFPFRVYLDHSRCRIFIIENIQHNWNWLSQYHTRFRDSDYFLVYCGWYHSDAFASEASTIFEILGLDRSKFFFLFNSPLEEQTFKRAGFLGRVINQNAWIDETIVMRPINVAKVFDAIYVARRSAFKRHHLASQVNNLALVAGNNHGNDVVPVPEHKYINAAPLKPDEVCEKINESRCGLILSASEGACFASSEYLLCGIPVVSTHSTGGRDVWYNDYNSIVCEPTAEAVAAAVAEFTANPRDPLKIRQMHIDLSTHFRNEFAAVIYAILARFNVRDIDPFDYFKKNFFHKLRKSYKPDFEQIFQ